MKNIVFIVDGYYPNFSAVGVCVGNVVEELSKDYNITIITKKSDNTQKNMSFNESYIRYINTTDNYIRNRISKKLKTVGGIKRNFLQVERIVVRGYGYICAFLKKRNVKNQDIQKFLYELEKINDKIDVIIPTCLPFESVLAALEFKNKCSYQVKVVPLLFDKFSKNSTLHRTENNKNKKFKIHLSLEKHMMEKCDKVLYMESWTDHLKEYFTEYEDKFCQIEHPLLKRITSSQRVSYDCEKINIVYTGALYKKIRSPLCALKLFSKLIESDRRITVHFYINGDCNSIVDSYCEKYPSNIINHGSVPTDYAKAAIINADILLSIGNSDVTQLPSKIFEYISTGNPIVHFYSRKGDPVITILNDYNNSCCVGNYDMSTQENELIIYQIINNIGNKIQFNEVEKIFYKATPKFTANKIIELL